MTLKAQSLKQPKTSQKKQARALLPVTISEAEWAELTPIQQETVCRDLESRVSLYRKENKKGEAQ